MSADGDARVHGTGAHGEEGDEHRGRSRSRGRAATEEHRSPSLTADGGPGAGIPAVEPLPEAETSVLEVSNANGKGLSCRKMQPAVKSARYPLRHTRAPK